MERAESYPVCLTAHDAMQLTGWSRTMTYRMLNVSEAGAFQVGARKFFHRDKLMEWLARQTLTNSGK